MDGYSLIPNLQRVVRSTYDENGHALSNPNFDTFANTATNLFHAYWAARDRDLKPITQHEQAAFKTEAVGPSTESGVRNFVKQCFERSHNESSLFRRIFAVESQFSSDPKSVFAALKSQYRGGLVTGTNIAPIATNMQSVLQGSDLRTICNVLGWLTNEYLLVDYDEDETPFASHCRELTARLLTEHLWTFADAFFEAEIAKSISRGVVPPEALKIGPPANGEASSNAFPPVRRAVELLIMFDQAMPKERCVSPPPLPTRNPLLTSPLATRQPRRLQNRQRIHRRPPPCRSTHQIHQKQHHRPRPLPHQEPPPPQERAPRPRDRRRPQQRRRRSRRHAALWSDLGYPAAPAEHHGPAWVPDDVHPRVVVLV